MKNIWWYQTYLLQLENYQLKRYFSLLTKRGWLLPKDFAPRQKLEATLKLLLIIAAGLILPVFFLYFLWPEHHSAALNGAQALGFVALLSLLWPVWLASGVILFWPLDAMAKRIIISGARAKIKKNPNLITVAVAGSYGKTTAKEAIAAALASRRVLKTPDNINTPLGIARLISGKNLEQFDFFVVELGEYYRGDIAGLAQLTLPKMVVITGINEAHLERLENLETTVDTIFESVATAPYNATVVLNADDPLIVENFERFVKDRKVLWYSANNDERCHYQTTAEEFHLDGSGLSFTIMLGNEMFRRATTRLLGNYAKGVVFLGMVVGEFFGVRPEEALARLEKLEPIKHRLQSINGQGGVLVIDDSYNGNPAGASEAVAVLAKFTDKRKIYLTPGLVEMGDRSDEIHRELGEKLARAADLVILIKNSVTPALAEGLEAAGFAKSAIMWFNSAPEAHAALPGILKSGDVILFQNDWGDNYV